MHSCEDDLKWVCEESRSKTCREGCVKQSVRSCIPTGIVIDPVIEVEECSHSRCGIPHCLEEEALITCIVFLETTTLLGDVCEHVVCVVTPLEAETMVCSSFLEHLLSDLDQVESLSDTVGQDGDAVGGHEPLLVEALSPVALVLHYTLSDKAGAPYLPSC